MINLDILNFIHQLNASQDLVIIGTPLMVYLLKAMISPSRIEAVALARILVPIIMFLTKRVENWLLKHPTNEALQKVVFNMRKNNIFGGPVG